MPAQQCNAIPPHDERAEAGIIGAMLCDEKAAEVVPQLISPADFYLPHNVTIYIAAVQLAKSLDIITLRDKLETDGNLERVGGERKLRSLLADVPSAVNFEAYCRIVREKAALRRTIVGLVQALELAERGDEHGAHAIVESLQRQRQSGAAQQTEPQDMQELAGRVVAEVLDGKSRQLVGLPTGLANGKFDELTEGIQPSRFWTLAAYPGYGKSTLISAMVRGFRARNKDAGQPLVFTTEMQPLMYCYGLVAALVGVPLRKVFKSQLTDGDKDRLRKVLAGGMLEGIKIVYAAGWRTRQVLDVARRHRETFGLPLCVVDMASLLRSDSESADKYAKMDAIAESFPSMAQELNTCLIAVAHIRKKPAGAKNATPDMDEIRDTASFAQFSDRILMLHRVMDESPFAPPRTITKIIQVKDRLFGDNRTLSVEWSNVTGEYREVKDDD